MQDALGAIVFFAIAAGAFFPMIMSPMLFDSASSRDGAGKKLRLAVAILGLVALCLGSAALGLMEVWRAAVNDVHGFGFLGKGLMGLCACLVATLVAMGWGEGKRRG